MTRPSIKVGVLGARSLVGAELLDLLMQAGYQPVAFTRKEPAPHTDGVQWRSLADLDASAAPGSVQTIDLWISLAPIWVLPGYLDALRACGAQRLVALSSTSRFTKVSSSVGSEQALAQRLADGESALVKWADVTGAEYVILRPTLIYGGDRDGNIAEISRFIRRFGFFPVFGKASGLRQPVRAADIAAACLAAVSAAAARNQAYNLSGAETLSYRQMVTRVFASMGRRPRILTVPLGAFRMALALLRKIPRYRHWTVGMAERMNEDLVFDNESARRDLNYRPGMFKP